MRIALDAMGGDHAPAAIVEGAVLAARELDIGVALVGDERSVQVELAKHDAPAGRIEVVHASQVIEMHESPATALRAKLDASMIRAVDLVASGDAQAVVSAGNSGAFMGAALWRLGAVKGVARPAIAALLPARSGSIVLLDAGANCDCRPKHLLQFAIMGDVYARRVLRIAHPRVALLNIGEEPAKGNELTKRAYAVLRASDLNFVGNLEGTEFASGSADVVVCDGFVGNLALKLGEGWAHLFVGRLQQALAQVSPAVREDQSLARALHYLQRTLDYSEYGGALLLGVKAVVVISHGRSSPKALFSALRVAKESVESGVVTGVARSLHDRSLIAQAEADHSQPQELGSN
ncbi:MAG TPA: phosphate acyltransferase PlsX [Armatimonadota bacterium]|nr:phosphate acyltransferase PlsX [Armatimonadota bacterium]